MGKHEKLSGKERTARHRASMRAQGYRLKQFWVPDLRIPEVRERIRRDAQKLADNSSADDDAFIESLIDWDSLPPYDAPVRGE